VPRSAVVASPYCGLPSTDGGVAFTGPTGTTVAVWFEAAALDPDGFVAVTTTRIVFPTSAETSAYVLDVAPAISPQPLPLVSHRRHWYPYESGRVPDQVPTAALSVWPSWTVPEIVGGDVFAGGMAATTAVCTDVAPAAPPAFDAVTTTRIVEPTSAAESTYVCPVIGTTSVQCAPVPSQRRHW
jgi:hypothetical protein